MSNTLKAFPVGTAGSKVLVPRGSSGSAISGSFPNPDLNLGSVVSVAAQISGIGDGVQGIASDGTYLYGVIAGEILYRLNVSDGTPHNPSNLFLGSGAKAATYDSGTASVWVTNQSSNQVYQVLVSSYSVINTYTTGGSPRGIASSGAYIWITNFLDNTVTRLLASDGSPQGVFPTGVGPLGVTFDGTYMWIANSIDNTVTLLLASDGSTFATYASSGTAPTDVAASNGLVWVTNSGSNNVAGIDTGGGVQRLTAVGNTPVAIVALGSSLWAANQVDGTVTQIANVDGSVTGTFPTGGAGVAPEAITSDGSHVWVGNNGTGLNIAKMADYGLFVGPVVGGTSISGGNITGTFPDGLAVSTLTAVSGPMSLDGGAITSDGGGNIGAISFTTETGAVNAMQYALSNNYIIDVSGNITLPGHASFDGGLVTTNGSGHLTVGSGLDVTGDINTSTMYRVSGSQIASTNLSDGASLVHNVAGASLVAAYPVGVSPFASASDGTSLWVINSGDNTVSRFALADGTPVGSPLTGFSNPSGICFDGTYMWVCDANSNSVFQIRASDASYIGSPVSVGTYPFSAVYDGTYIWVSCTSSNNAYYLNISPSQSTVAGNVATDQAPEGICFDGTNVWTACVNSSSLTIIVAATQTAASFSPISLSGAASDVCYDGVSRVWAAIYGSGDLVAYNVSDGSPAGFNPVSVGGSVQYVCSDGTYIWASQPGDNSVAQVNLSGSPLSYTSIGTQPAGITAAGGSVWVTEFSANNVGRIELFGSGAVPSGPAGGGLSGAYPNPVVSSAAGSFSVGSNLSVGGLFLLTSGNAPATSGSAGATGQFAWDSGFLYVCISTNTWVRAALSTF